MLSLEFKMLCFKQKEKRKKKKKEKEKVMEAIQYYLYFYNLVNLLEIPVHFSQAKVDFDLFISTVPFLELMNYYYGGY